MNGAAAHWLILARSSGSESELSAVRFSTYSFAGDIHERTLRSRHASLRRTGHRRNRSAPILNYQAPVVNRTFQSTPDQRLMQSAAGITAHPADSAVQRFSAAPDDTATTHRPASCRRSRSDRKESYRHPPSSIRYSTNRPTPRNARRRSTRWSPNPGFSQSPW